MTEIRATNKATYDQVTERLEALGRWDAEELRTAVSWSSEILSDMTDAELVGVCRLVSAIERRANPNHSHPDLIDR